jgi:ankyrin repeat protein
MVSALLQAKYEGRNDEAEQLARSLGEATLDVFEAAALGRIDRLRALIDADASVIRSIASDGFTPLHLAAFFGQPASAVLLLERGADANAVAANAMKVTPLHSAAATRQRTIVRALLERGADPNAKQQGGWTPIQASANSGDAETTSLLLAKGADPRLANDDGKTAIDLAIAKGHDALLPILRGD